VGGVAVKLDQRYESLTNFAKHATVSQRALSNSEIGKAKRLSLKKGKKRAKADNPND